MKSLKLIFLAALICTLISCSDDSEPLDALVGEWATTSLVATNCTNSSENGTADCGGIPCLNIVIGGDGSYTLSGPAITETETGKMTATETTVKLCANNLTEEECTNQDNNAYTLIDGNLTVVFSEDCTYTAVFQKK